MTNEKRFFSEEDITCELYDRVVHGSPAGAQFANAFAEFLKEIPTVDAVEVVHGRWEECDWVKYDGHSECVRYPKAAWYCSNCRNAFKKELLWKDNYCPNCGAKMDGDKNG